MPLLPPDDEEEDVSDFEEDLEILEATSWRAKYERYYVLTVFSLFAFAQGVMWLTFSSVNPDSLQEYYTEDLDFPAVALLLNWGPIIGILFFPVTLWIMSRPDGFHEACVTGMILCVLGAIIRLIPTFVGPSLRHRFSAIMFLHTGQILNAAGGPLCMATTSRLSSIWFPEEHRTWSTAIAISSNSIGTNVAFIMGPYISHAGGIGALLYSGLALAILPAVLAIIHFPRWPHHVQRVLPKPILVRVQGLATPDLNGRRRSVDNNGVRQSSSISSASDMGDHDSVNNEDSDFASADSDDTYVVPPSPGKHDSLRLMLSNRNFILTILCGGGIAGIATAWQTMLQPILKGHFEDTTIGLIGCFNGMAANLGSIMIGLISKRERLRVELVVGLGMQVFALAFFVDATRHETFTGVLTAVLCTGFTYGLCSPIFYELAAKLIYPVNEGISISVLIFLLNISACTLTALAPVIGPSSLTGVFIAMLIASVLIMGFCVKTSSRQTEDLPDREEAAHSREHDQRQPQIGATVLQLD